MRKRIFLEASEPEYSQELNLNDNDFFNVLGVKKNEIESPYNFRLNSSQKNKMAAYLKNAKLTTMTLNVVWEEIAETVQEKKDAFLKALKNTRNAIELDDSGINKLLRKYEGCPYNFNQYDKYIKEEKFLAALEFLHLIAQCLNLNNGYFQQYSVQARKIMSEEI